MSSKIIKALAICSSIVLSSVAFAQNVSDTYSQLGVGRPDGVVQAEQMGMGGLSAAYITQDGLNFYNPASYTFTSNVVMNFGGEFQFTTMTNNLATAKKSTAMLNQFSIGVPIRIRKHAMGLAFGYVPYSQAGYNFSSTDTVRTPEDTVGVQLNYKGRGGIDRIFLGLSTKIYKGLSIGVNGNFYFGSLITQKNTIAEAPGFLNSSYERNNRITDFSFDAGLQYTDTIKTFDSLGRKSLNPWFITAGASYTYGNSMRTKTTILAQYFTGTDLTGTPYLIDTLQYKAISQTTFPSSVRAGFSFGRINKFLIGTEFQYHMWQDFRYGNGNPESLFTNSYTAIIGAKISPNKEKGFFNKLHYRIGARYGNSYLTPKNSGMTNFGISFGVGFPILYGTMLRDDFNRPITSMLNIGVEYGGQIHSNPTVTTQNVWRLVVSFNIRDRKFLSYKFK